MPTSALLYFETLSNIISCLYYYYFLVFQVDVFELSILTMTINRPNEIKDWHLSVKFILTSQMGLTSRLAFNARHITSTLTLTLFHKHPLMTHLSEGFRYTTWCIYLRSCSFNIIGVCNFIITWSLSNMSVFWSMLTHTFLFLSWLDKQAWDTLLMSMWLEILCIIIRSIWSFPIK